MPRLSFITDEATQSFAEAVGFARAAGLAGLELRSVGDMPVDLIPSETLREWRRVLDGEGLRVPCLSGSFYKCPIHGRDRELDKLRRLMEAAHILGAGLIRGFAFFTPEAGPLPPRALAKYFEAPAALLRGSGLKMVLEADPSVNTPNHASLAALLSELDPEVFGAVYDPGNDLFDTAGEAPWPDGLEAVRPYLLHVHVKDAVYGPDGRPRCLAPGEGLVPWRDILRDLKICGYGGWLSLEPHYRKGTVLTEAQMRLPAGSDFTRGGLEAARESAAAMKTMLEALS